nr:polysaccharide pyruvyl transferase family protein [Variovorax boronicumulans]
MRERPINVEVLGIWPHNKGALLMLEAIRERFRQELPQARLAVPFSWPAEQRLALGLHCTYPREHGRVDTARLSDLLPSRWRKGVGLLSPRDVDVVLDASGFAYGDYWGLPKLQHRLLRVARHWKTPARTLILLPQALGPFEAPGIAAAWREAQRSADLVYVRDRASWAFVEAAGAQGTGNVRLSPDFTNLLHPALPDRLAAVQGAFLVIPNERVVGRDTGRRAAYLQFLRSCAERFLATGRKVLLLVHEGAGDRRLALELNALLPRPVDVIDEPSPLVTKAVIGAAYATVSSRYHGLVSALSAAVPSAACGWAHKYGELMSDHGCAHLNIDLSSDAAHWSHQLDQLEQAAQSDSIRTALRAAAQQQQHRSQEMWAEVFSLLRRKHPTKEALHP